MGAVIQTDTATPGATGLDREVSTVTLRQPEGHRGQCGEPGQLSQEALVVLKCAGPGLLLA